jgi:hypothetical protein
MKPRGVAWNGTGPLCNARTAWRSAQSTLPTLLTHEPAWRLARAPALRVRIVKLFETEEAKELPAPAQ